MGNSIRIGTQVTGVAKAEGDLDRLKNKFAKVQAMGSKGFATGVGAAATLKAFSLIDRAAAGLVDIFVDSAEAARQEEVSIQKLGSALEANVPNWDHNTEAIERTLKARMDLGFSDDEQRDSLAKIVVATKDVTKALDVQRTAMDLARLKGISLADASAALIKVEGGQFRALKALGIQLKAGATATDALAAVQKAARGQAEDYAETNSGKLLTSQVKLGETMERLGTVSMPILTGAAELAARAIEDLVNVSEGAGNAVSDSLNFLAGPTSLDAIQAGAKDTSVALLKIDRDAYEASRGVDHSLDKMTTSAEDLAKEVWTNTRKVSKSFSDMVDDLTSDAGKLIDDVYDPLIEKARLEADQHEYNQLRKVLASKTATEEEKQDAKDRMLSLSKSADETRLSLLESGNLTAADTKEWLDKLQKRYDKATGDAKYKIGLLIDKIKELGALTEPGITIAVHNQGAGTKKLASGGHYSAGEPRIVGEDGPEFDIPDHSGTIVPNGKLGGDTFYMTFNGTGPVTESTAVGAVQRLRRIARGRAA